MSMFEKASKQKLRFDTSVGNLTVEDLWDLPLTSVKAGCTSLDDLAIALNRAVKESEEGSFVVKTNKVNAALQLRFDIVRRVIEVKLAAAETAAKRKAAKDRNERIMTIMAEKADEDLKGKTLEELRELLNEGEEE